MFKEFGLDGAGRNVTQELSVQKHLITLVVTEALRYRSGGRGFNSRLCHCNFSLT